jgi:molybdopterin-guanine dinucleotide biosynthesis protein A
MQIEGFVLIGGRSSRLGRDKATVELGGMSLAGRAAKTVQNALAPECVTLVAGNAAQFEVNAFLTDTAVVFDLVEGRGPLGGIHAALSYARTPWIFVLACDYPFVPPELLKLLGGFVSDDFGAVAPEQSDGRLQPLCAFYRTEVTRPVVEKIINQPRVPPPLRETLRELSPRIVKYDEYAHLHNASDLFININTVDDLENVLLRQNR